MRWSFSGLMLALIIVSAGCTHVKSAESNPSDASRVYIVSRDASGVGLGLAIGGASGHDCQKEHEECMERCWDKRYPWPHSEEQGGWYYKACVAECRKQFMECDKEQEDAQKEREKKLNFPGVDRAISWINGHKGEVTVGTLVVAGGSVFALAVNPLGWLVLIPVVAIQPLPLPSN